MFTQEYGLSEGFALIKNIYISESQCTNLIIIMTLASHRDWLKWAEVYRRLWWLKNDSNEGQLIVKYKTAKWRIAVGGNMLDI